MAADDSFHEFVKELFAGMGPVQIRRMFGGAGVFRDGLMFALLADETIHIKANDAGLKNELIAEGSGPFVWTPASGPREGEHVDLGYWRLPDRALDDPEAAAIWGRKAFALAKAKAALKPKSAKPKNAKPKNAQPKNAAKPKTAKPKRAKPTKKNPATLSAPAKKPAPKRAKPAKPKRA